MGDSEQINQRTIVRIYYINHRGEQSVRRIIPRRLWFGSTKWHTYDQWLLDAYDVGKEADRTFAMNKLKFPAPYFGGKSRVASLVWDHLGDPDNYVEPFVGSGAVLLARNKTGQTETINDAVCYVANAWRAMQRDPDSVAAHADWPISEIDLHARHRYLVDGADATHFRERMLGDPDFYDAKFAGWWLWGLSQWIGSGWCVSHKRSTGHLSEQLPYLTGVQGVHAQGRPQLADAFSRGRGVHGHDQASACAERRAWLTDWMRALADRLRPVRVCCGHWSRICDSLSTTTRLGTTGVFLDPPYPTHGTDGERSRCDALYATDGDRGALDALRDEVLAWCRRHGPDKRMRIAVCGLDTDGYAVLEQEGWDVVAWSSSGYQSRNAKGRERSKRERIWFSPGCLREMTLFD